MARGDHHDGAHNFAMERTRFASRSPRRWARNRSMNIEANILKYIYGDQGSGGVKPLERYASFDYCFNYFQTFRESGTLAKVADDSNMQESCLQLGFYLASWGMLRGSSQLLKKSVKVYEPVIRAIASADDSVWDIDAHEYTPSNIKKIIGFEGTLQQALPASKSSPPSPTLVTKIMLGVFGNVPAFGTFFKDGFGVSTFGPKSLSKVGQFYWDNESIVEKYRINTLDFLSGSPTKRRYSRAKVIDMVFFIEGGGKSIE